MSRNLQAVTHPDADQLSVFVEGAATAREQKQMLAHLADCAECRKAVFLMQPHEQTQRATATPAKGLVWRRLLAVGLPAAALACGLIAVLVYIRPHGIAPRIPQQIGSVRQPEIKRPGTTAAPATNSERDARSGRQPSGPAPSGAAQNPSRQKKNAAAGLNLPEAKSHQMAGNIARPQTTAASPSVSVPAADEAIVPQNRIQSELPLNGKNVTNLQQPSTPADTQAAPLQNSLAEKKDLPALVVERASGQDATAAGISGSITDRTGAIIPGVTVTLRDEAGKTRQTSTGVDGSFHLTELPAGQYELTATATGFKTNKQSIDLKPSELAMLQPVLDVAAVSETLEVTSAAPSIETESANVAGLPSGLPVWATVSYGKRLLSLDNSGNVFLSRNGGKKWKKVKPQWTGKAVQVELTPPAPNGALFQLTTDAGAVWTSKDGAHWHQP